MQTYFCFIERDIFTTPYMEPLMADTAVEALIEAEALCERTPAGLLPTSC